MTGPAQRLRAVTLAVLVLGSLLTTASVAPVTAAGNQSTDATGVLVEDPSSSSPVTAGETLTVTANVTNTGDSEATQTVELRVAGAVRNSTTVTLAPGEGDAGEYEATVASDDDTASTHVTVEAATDPPDFEVSGLTAPANATVGDIITVSATVTNTGDRHGTQTITFGVDTDGNGSLEPLANKERTLEPGEETTISFDVDTSVLAPGTYTHGVFTANDTATAEITLAADDPERGVYSFVQGSRCFDVQNFGDGTQSVDEFYGYDEADDFSSQGTLDLQENQVSNLFVYGGSEGDSLVLLHDAVGGQYGNTLTMQFSGLPADGTWAVQDDNYPGRDDDFNLGTTQADIDWKWSSGRTDGAAFRGLNETGDLAITIDPRFNEDAQFWGDWPWSGDENNRTESWRLLSADGSARTVTTLDRSEPVTVQTGRCADRTDEDRTDNSTSEDKKDKNSKNSTDDGGETDTGTDTDPTAFIEAPSRVETYETFRVSGAGSTDDTGIAEYRWDFDGDGEYNRVSSKPTTSFTYTRTGEYEVSLLVVDEDGNTDTTATGITVEREDERPSVDLKGPTEVTAGENVTYEATNISDEAPIDAVYWTVDGETGSDGETFETAFETDGTYDVTVTVTDAAGNTRSETLATTVTEPVEEPDEGNASDPGDSGGSDDQTDSGESEAGDTDSDDTGSSNDASGAPVSDTDSDADVGLPDLSDLTDDDTTETDQDAEETVPVTDLRVDQKTVEPGTELTVSAVLAENVTANESMTVTVRRIGPGTETEQVANVTVTVDNASAETHSVPLTINEPGTYELSANGETAAVSVVEPDGTAGNGTLATETATDTPTDERVTITDETTTEATETATGGSGPGFGLVAALLALVVVLALAGRAARR